LKIELKNINLKIKNKIVLNNFSMVVNKSDKIIISGNSGIGKSTIFRILLGFQRFDSGSYIIDDKDFRSYDISNIRKYFSYVDQDVSLRKMKVQDYLNEISNFHNNNINNIIDENLCDYFSFENELLEKNMIHLSGGERQRLAIIISIMLDKPCFLLDEVTSSLDRNLKKKVVDYFENSKKTVISISHDSIWTKNDVFKRIDL